MKIIYVFLLSIALYFQTFAQNKPKYIFLCIGDGMGQVQAQVTDTYLKAVKHDSLSFMYFPQRGVQSNYSLSSAITCSAAAGTALACGVKTFAGYIGVGQNETEILQSIAVKAKQNGLKVGILTSVSIDHATPAVFYAHDISRNSYHSIAMQLPLSDFDFFGGGSFVSPIDKSENAYDLLKSKGYQLVTSVDSLKIVPNLHKKVCLFNPSTELPYTIDNDAVGFKLQSLTKTAIETLDNPKGFFMMIEGGKIDWACHSNDAATAIHETIAFGESVEEALKFYETHKDETLIIVTADHETGGMAFGSALYPYYTNVSILENQKVSYVTFEKMLIEEIEKKNSVFTFSKCMQMINSSYSIDSNKSIQFSHYDSIRLLRAYDFVMNPIITIDKDEALFLYNTSNITAEPKDKVKAIGITMNKILAEKAGIGFTTFAHSGVQIPVYAIGVSSEMFSGMYDNTDIAKKIEFLIKK